MTAPTARIKFYGYSGDDPEAFCRNLAALLNISIEQAQDTLAEVRNGPVILAERIDLKAAEKFVEILSSKQGLCLAEPEQIEAIEASPEVTATPEHTSENEPTEKESFLSKAVLIGLACAITVLVVYMGIGFISSVRKINRDRPEPIQKVQPQETEPDDGSAERHQIEKITKLIQERDKQAQELENKLNDLKVQLVLEQEYLKYNPGSMMPGNAEVARRTKLAKDLQKEIVVVSEELKVLKQWLKWRGVSRP